MESSVKLSAKQARVRAVAGSGPVKQACFPPVTLRAGGGAALGKFLEPKVLTRIAAVAFVLLGVWTWFKT